MILHPAIIALLVSSFLVTAMVLLAFWFGVRILRRWDLRSGSSLQLDLERRTYLISTVLAYVFGFQLISLFLLVYTADSLSTLFTGAMCAAGTFNVNGFGYPLLVLKIVNFLLAGLWLIMNHADNQAYDYPLVRIKYGLLMAIAPLVVLETVLQVLYFRGLRPEVITSCCGSLFSTGSATVASDIASLPGAPMRIVFAAVIVTTVVLGWVFTATGRGGYAFALSAGATFVVGLASLLSFISPAVYELPTHHCPFCVLQREYHYIGYLLYAALFGGAVCGMGVGLLMPFRGLPSLTSVLPSQQRRLAVLSLAFTVVLAMLTGYILLTSNLQQ
jgi:hypothetical protein